MAPPFASNRTCSTTATEAATTLARPLHLSCCPSHPSRGQQSCRNAIERGRNREEFCWGRRDRGSFQEVRKRYTISTCVGRQPSPLKAREVPDGPPRQARLGSTREAFPDSPVLFGCCKIKHVRLFDTRPGRARSRGISTADHTDFAERRQGVGTLIFANKSDNPKS